MEGEAAISMVLEMGMVVVVVVVVEDGEILVM
jgi:hypothetical protein